MTRHLSRAVIVVIAVIVSFFAARPALATVFPGNGDTGFTGAVGNGSLTVTDDGNGGVVFSYALASGSFGSLGNDIVIYLDNGTGGGISDTSELSDSADGGRRAISEYGGASGEESILTFGGLMAPQYGIDISNGYGDIFQISPTRSNFTFVDGADPGMASANSTGLTYTVTGGTATIDIPVADFGLSAFSANTINLASIEVSETGYSSNEGSEPITGTQGWNQVQTIGGDDSFTTAAIPEGSTVGMLVCGAGLLGLYRKRTMPWRAQDI